MKPLPLIAPLCLLALATCAELSQEVCEEGDWLAIGQRDGSRGRSAGFVERHVESCGRFEIAVDAAAWEQGRQQGLRVFCTPESQYQAGRDGRPFNAICAAENLPEHREAYNRGRAYFLLTQRIERLRDEIHDLRHEAGVDHSLASLQFEAFMLRMDIDLLLRERRQYEAL